MISLEIWGILTWGPFFGPSWSALGHTHHASTKQAKFRNVITIKRLSRQFEGRGNAFGKCLSCHKLVRTCCTKHNDPLRVSHPCTGTMFLPLGAPHGSPNTCLSSQALLPCPDPRNQQSVVLLTKPVRKIVHPDLLSDKRSKNGQFLQENFIFDKVTHCPNGKISKLTRAARVTAWEHRLGYSSHPRLANGYLGDESGNPNPTGARIGRAKDKDKGEFTIYIYIFPYMERGIDRVWRPLHARALSRRISLIPPLRKRVPTPLFLEALSILFLFFLEIADCDPDLQTRS